MLAHTHHTQCHGKLNVSQLNGKVPRDQTRPCERASGSRWLALPVGRPPTSVISGVGAGFRSELGSLIRVEVDSSVSTPVGCIFARVENGPAEA
jgi:hypothetical protein